MNFKFFSYIGNNQAKILKAAWYASALVLAILIALYIVLFIKAHVQVEETSRLDQIILAYASDQQRAVEKDYLEYKKKISDLTMLVAQHKTFSNAFSLIEQKTLPSVWFSDFTVSLDDGKIGLKGQTQDMKTLSEQVRIFEEASSYVQKTEIVFLQASGPGQITFALDMYVKSKIFTEDTETFFAGPAEVQKSGQAGSQTYTSADGSFTIKIPGSWVKDPNPPFGSIVIFSEPEDVKEPAEAFHATIDISSGAFKTATLDGYVRAHTRALSNVLQGYAQEEDGAVSIAGREGRMISGTFSRGGLQLRNLQLITVKDATAYVVTGVAMNSQWDTYGPLLESGLLSFMLK